MFFQIRQTWCLGSVNYLYLHFSSLFSYNPPCQLLTHPCQLPCGRKPEFNSRLWQCWGTLPTYDQMFHTGLNLWPLVGGRRLDGWAIEARLLIRIKIRCLEFEIFIQNQPIFPYTNSEQIKQRRTQSISDRNVLVTPED